MSDSTEGVRPMSDADMAAAFGDPEDQTTAQTEPQAQEQQQEPQRDRMVPHAALHEERERRKASDARLADWEARYNRLETRTNMLLEQRFAQPPGQVEAPKPPPGLDDDARGYVENLGREVQELRADRETRQRHEQQQAHDDRLITWGQQQERDFRVDTPDYDAASAFLRQSRIAELRELGVPENQIPVAIRQDLIRVAQYAAQNGGNPAARIYAVAKSRGYVKAAAEPTAEQRADTIARGQQLTSTPSGGGGTGGVMTAQKLSAMSDAEFNAWYSTATDAQRRAAMGS